MCAIAGILDLDVPEEVIARMQQTMIRRGPDGNGVFRKPNCTLLHSRLAIIDPDGGAQPMTLRWGDENYILIYNGELYNTGELTAELRKLGHSFLGHSDTEVVLHAYAQWGQKCLDQLNGIFAFAVLEEKNHRVFLARDRIGVKPLFYTELNHGLIFASEIKTILAYPQCPVILDRDGLCQLILLGPGRVPGSGVLHGIKELKPGYWAYYQNGRLTQSRYWYLRDFYHTDSFEETSDKVRELVSDAIRRQMISDVPIGTFLSGGLDSSIITALCAAECAEKGETLTTFSVDYAQNDRYFQPGKFQPSSDHPYILKMLQAVHSNHFWTTLSSETLLAQLEEATIARDLPGMADVDFSLLAFSKDIRKNVKVGLSGECADEIFGGYPWYRDPQIRAEAGFPWSQTTMQRLSILRSGVINPEYANEFVMDHYLDTCKTSDILPDQSPEEKRIKEMVNLNFKWFMQTLLDRKDRMSMFCGLEVRVPFCDYRIAEYLYTVPWSMKEYLGREKGLLRHAFHGVLPDEILHRKKSPYPKTFDPKYEQMVTQKLHKLLAENDSPMFSFVDPQRLRASLQQEGEWPWYGQLMRRPQTIAYLLQIDFWLRHYQIDLNL